MTNRSTGGNGRGGCPDPEQIAAHAERRLAPDEAARLDEHIASCADCYAVYAGTLQFRLDEEKRSGPPKVAFLQQPLLKMAAGLLLATGVALSLYHVRRATPPGDRAPLVAELARALGDRRLIEPRLTGGFQHGRLIVLRSGDAPKGLDAQPAAVLAAVARIREKAEGDTSPEALGALGVTYLVSGDIGAAVKALESATEQAPDNPRLWSDLSAAYLARATRADEPADIPQALESAEKAIALPEPPIEAWFNRALALEALHLTDAARKAWQDYLDRDAETAWADEARQHLEALPKPRQSSVEDDKSRVRAALGEGPAAVQRLATSSASLLRDYLEDDLLPAWAEAHLIGTPDERLYREHALLLGEALSKATGDQLGAETARELFAPTGVARLEDPLRSQALGFRAFRDAERRYDLQESSCLHFREASRDLGRGGSPYVAWARLRVALACLMPTEPRAALAELAYLESLAEARSYPHFLGRVQWMQGFVHGHRAELTTAHERYRLAQLSLRKTLDTEAEATVLVAMAENLHFLGERRVAWRERHKALAHLDGVRSPRRRHGLLLEPALACQDARQLSSARYFADAAVAGASGSSQPLLNGDALIRRAGILNALGGHELASADLRESRRWIDRIHDESQAKRLIAEANAIEGEITLPQQPEEAIRLLDSAILYFRATVPPRLAPLRFSVARAHTARGSREEAERQLVMGIEELEGQRTSQHDKDYQVSFFDQASPLFDEMVRIEVAKGHPERALTFLERGRARQLVDSLRGVPGGTRPSLSSALRPLAPDAIRETLPDGLALIYYRSLDDHLYTWVLTRQELHFRERVLPAKELTRLTTAYRTALESGRALDIVRHTGALLHDVLLRPLASLLFGQRTLIFVPDDTLQFVSFASLWDQDASRYLVETHTLGLSPSGTVLAQASAQASSPRIRAPRALLVGNPRFTRSLVTGLQDLPQAEQEAAEIARLYLHPGLLTGKDATRTAFLKGLRGSDIVHFAGHAVSSVDAPATAHLFLAPDPKAGDSGILFLHELGREALPRTRLVVLAACHSDAGQVSRMEGALSLGRPFLAAAVPSVVASRWSIDDTISRRFFVAFHRAFLASGDASSALRQAQITFLREGDRLLAHPSSWAAFVHMGGISRDSLSRGEPS